MERTERECERGALHSGCGELVGRETILMKGMIMEVSIGIDIGGTKCALSVGECSAGAVKILHREEFPTKGMTWQEVLEEFGKRIEGRQFANIGISCGGPLDSKAGVIMSPPNLPGWDNVPVVKFFALVKKELREP